MPTSSQVPISVILVTWPLLSLAVRVGGITHDILLCVFYIFILESVFGCGVSWVRVVDGLLVTECEVLGGVRVLWPVIFFELVCGACKSDLNL